MISIYMLKYKYIKKIWNKDIILDKFKTNYFCIILKISMLLITFANTVIF